MRARVTVWVGTMVLASCGALCAQALSAAHPSPAAPAEAIAGGRLHGVVKCGNIPLPGVTVTAQNTLTGKRYATTSDVAGAWSMTIPQNGRYVLRTQFAAFASGAQEAVLNASSRDLAVNFDLTLASRAPAQQQTPDTQMGQAVRQMAGNGPQNLNLMSALADNSPAGAGGSAAGAALPAAAQNADFGSESIAVNGQAGAVSPMAGVDMERMRDSIDAMRSQSGSVWLNGVPSSAGFGGGSGGFGGDFGGPAIFGGGGRRGNFRGFNPAQPHGALYWNGSNSALDAQPFSLQGQPQHEPASGTNRFGLTLMTAPFIPGLTKPSGKDHLFLNLSGSRNSSPVDQYATVPTVVERAGNIPGHAPVAQAIALLKYIPEPNLPGDTLNFHRLTTAQSNTTMGNVRYMRSLGANAAPFGMGGGGRRSRQTQGLHQSLNGNYNFSRAASDTVGLLPELGGKSRSNSDSVQAGYTIGHGKFTSIFNAGWNRTSSRTTNPFTNGENIATTQLGIFGPNTSALNSNPLNYGLPNIVLSSFTGITEVQPNFQIQQTISLSETLSWYGHKHNPRVGGDYRRVHRDFLGGSNATGTFYFTGIYTGSALDDFLQGEPQETSLASAPGKSYLRENVFDLYVNDDWRARSNLTFNYGVRYEFFAPYTEKDGRLSMVDTSPTDGFASVSQVQAGGASVSYGKLPASLLHPFYWAFAPRIGVAWRLPKQTVVRAGYGMNFTAGQYAVFASAMAYQPPFANEQTNISTNVCPPPAADCFSLANGFPSPNTIGNVAVDPHYRLPYVQVYNIDVQKTLLWGIVMNAGYNGSRGSNLDVKIAPSATASSPHTNPGNVPFFYQEYGAFSRFNAATVRANKRLSSGISLGASYQYAHSIDDAGSVGGASSVVAQDWQDIAADEGNSNFDVRHRVTGNYLYELPFGKDKFFFTTGKMSHLLEGFSVSSSFTFATGTPLTPTLQTSAVDVARGTAGTERLDRVPGVSLTAGGGSLKRWFNTGAFTPPAGIYGTASRNCIPGPGTVQNNMSLSKTVDMGDTRSFEFRATANNVFNTVQYAGVNTMLPSSVDRKLANNFGQVTSAGTMRQFQFMGRFRF